MTHPDGGRRWWIVGVVVPLAAAIIGLGAVVLGVWLDDDGGGPPTASGGAAEGLPGADPIPTDACFDPCYPELLPVADYCHDGVMTACDDLWKQFPDPRGESGANWDDEKSIYLYGLSCGGRRNGDYPVGYRPKDCADEWPGHG